MRRREFLGSTGAALGTALAGCSGSGQEGPEDTETSGSTPDSGNSTPSDSDNSESTPEDGGQSTDDPTGFGNLTGEPENRRLNTPYSEGLGDVIVSMEVVEDEDMMNYSEEGWEFVKEQLGYPARPNMWFMDVYSTLESMDEQEVNQFNREHSDLLLASINQADVDVVGGDYLSIFGSDLEDAMGADIATTPGKLNELVRTGASTTEQRGDYLMAEKPVEYRGETRDVVLWTPVDSVFLTASTEAEGTSILKNTAATGKDVFGGTFRISDSGTENARNWGYRVMLTTEDQVQSAADYNEKVGTIMAVADEDFEQTYSVQINPELMTDNDIMHKVAYNVKDGKNIKTQGAYGMKNGEVELREKVSPDMPLDSLNKALE